MWRSVAVRDTGQDSMEDFVVIHMDNCTMKEPLHIVVAKLVQIVGDSLHVTAQTKPI